MSRLLRSFPRGITVVRVAIGVLYEDIPARGGIDDAIFAHVIEHAPACLGHVTVEYIR